MCRQQNDPKMYVSSEEGLEKYLHYLKQLGVAKKRETQAREVFMRLYERAQKLCAKHLNRYPDLIEKDGKTGGTESGRYQSVQNGEHIVQWSGCNR